MFSAQQRRRDPRSAWLLAAAVFAVLATLTSLVWREQITHLRQLQQRHTDDIASQAARRLSVFVDSHIRSARVFARRWATHETRDFSRTRFEEFGAVVIGELTGYGAVLLRSSEHQEPWSVPRGAPVAAALESSDVRALLAAASARGGEVVSAPMRALPGETGLFVVLPLLRGEEALGHLIIYIRAATLIDDCFHSRIQAEFSFVVRDEETALFRWDPGDALLDVRRPGARAQLSFPVGDRSWQLTMAPRRAATLAVGWSASLGVPLIGYTLSLGLAWLVLLLRRRVEAVHRAHGQALHEIEERERVEGELRASQLRHAQLSRKVLVAQEEERARLSRELHDELGQILTAQRLELGWLQKRAGRVATQHPAELGDTVALVERATDELRRICRGLRPPLLDDLGLLAALRLLVEEHEERLGVTITFAIDLDEEQTPVPPEVALCTYRVLQESLTNVGRHAAAVRVEVRLAVEGGTLELEVVDDGAGFDVSMSEGGACGLDGMRERAALVSGRLEIESARGRGTRVWLRAPLVTSEEGEA